MITPNAETRALAMIRAALARLNRADREVTPEQAYDAIEQIIAEWRRENLLAHSQQIATLAAVALAGALATEFRANLHLNHQELPSAKEPERAAAR